ncbi:MAG: hypothetical protein M0D57_15315 [Sphingobacteriales bacterium JAD_PAG50586_3]|nr:MAG: hypothetical protein M0D57_15315 [Sphingobacteriales bacterium JAD_PAG50586_3]
MHPPNKSIFAPGAKLEKMLFNSRWVKFIFFGNYFYGLCAVALAIEATLQQNYKLNHPLFYVLLFIATVLYYTRAYISDSTTDITSNVRAKWYSQNKTMVITTQVVLVKAFIICGIVYLQIVGQGLLNSTPIEWFLYLIFPVVALAYYIFESKALSRYSLRNVGWLKPFVIGLIWAGLATVYPILVKGLEDGHHFEPTQRLVLLTLKNTMYVGLLCIMFDFKDYRIDYQQKLNTFIVRLGLRKTVFTILFPLILLGLTTFIIYALSQDFSFGKILLNTIPFVALVMVALSLLRRKSIFYYLIIVDGLMLLKGICGTIAMLYF